MFGTTGKEAVSITDKAANQIVKLMMDDNKKGLRIGVKKGGCAGMDLTDNDQVDQRQCARAAGGIRFPSRGHQAPGTRGG